MMNVINLKKIKFYQIYTDILNHNGLPYEIFKSNIPIIQNTINSILKSFVKFTIDIIPVYKNKNSIIDINIKYDKSYNISLSCGFEQFIISIATRIALSKFSIISKPSFIFIDEGFACLDTNKINNIDIIFVYLKIIINTL